MREDKRESGTTSIREMSRCFWSSLRLQIGKENAGESISGPREGHSGSSVQRREQAKQFPGREQPATEAKQLPSPKSTELEEEQITGTSNLQVLDQGPVLADK